MKKKIFGVLWLLTLAGSLAASVPAFADEAAENTEINIIYAEPETEDTNNNESDSSNRSAASDDVSIRIIRTTAAVTGTESGSEETAEKEEASPEVLGQQVTEYAMQFVGRPYSWGGTSLTNGTDCSGFTMSVFKNFGVSLPHSSSSQRKVGAAVNGLAEARPGDLVCYSGHVALYVGGGKIVHAMNKKNGITVSDASYKKIVGIRRVI